MLRSRFLVSRVCSLYNFSRPQYNRFFSLNYETATESEAEDQSTRAEISQCLLNEGLSRGGINTVFERFPDITKLDVQRDVQDIINWLKGKSFDVATMLETNPLILDRDPKYMVQIMEFMTNLGMEEKKLIEFIHENPKFLTTEYKNLYWIQAFFEDELGFEEVASTIDEVPEIMLKTENDVRSICDTLHHIGLDVAEVVETVPWILTIDSTQLKTATQFMFDLVGIQQKRVFTLCPQLLEQDSETLKTKTLYLHKEGHNVRNILLTNQTYSKPICMNYAVEI